MNGTIREKDSLIKVEGLSKAKSTIKMIDNIIKDKAEGLINPVKTVDEPL